MTPLSKPVAKVRMLVVVLVGMAAVRKVVARLLGRMIASQIRKRKPKPFGGRRKLVVKVTR
jgi:hypothetical protein